MVSARGGPRGRARQGSGSERLLIMGVLLARLWGDDRGAFSAIEFLLIASILVLGLVVGLTDLRNAIVAEFEAIATAISPSASSCSAVCTPPASITVIDVVPCP
jgi:Flp pilus assembly pilin Flp